MKTIVEAMIKLETADGILSMIDTLKPVSVGEVRGYIQSFRDDIADALKDLAGEQIEPRPIPRGMENLPSLDDVICDLPASERDCRRGTYRCGTGEEVEDE